MVSTSTVQVITAIYKCFKDQNLITEEIGTEINDKIIKMEMQNHLLFGYTSIVNIENIEDLRHCSRHVPDLEITGQISSDVQGNEGSIYFASSKLKRKDKLIVKLWKYSLNPEDMDESLETIEYTSLMSNLNLTPKLYDAFYCTLKEELFQVIIMDSCEKDLRFLKPHEININVLEQVGNILWNMLFFNLLCVDIKLDNFVQCIENGKPVIKMIDFSGRWCKFYYKTAHKESLYILLMIQFLTYRVPKHPMDKPPIFSKYISKFMDQDPILNKLKVNFDFEFKKCADLLEPSHDLSKPSELYLVREVIILQIENKYLSPQQINEIDLHGYKDKIKKDLQIK